MMYIWYIGLSYGQWMLTHWVALVMSVFCVADLRVNTPSSSASLPVFCCFSPLIRADWPAACLFSAVVFLQNYSSKTTEETDITCVLCKLTSWVMCREWASLKSTNEGRSGTSLVRTQVGSAITQSRHGTVPHLARATYHAAHLNRHTVVFCLTHFA